MRLIPAPRGTSIVAAGVSKKLLQMAGIDDCYTSACGTTATAGNFAMATRPSLTKKIIPRGFNREFTVCEFVRRKTKRNKNVKVVKKSIETLHK